ncbi:hypothetical protein HHL22_00050 [Hymenobacter sp. RP-2-7]|uniref:Uncharacterized protein n=1 Tax=Hymenobacter polaris TaxID=2682546 RepID=A0A7Y0AA47_9BACT|nr:hypothetical protein [Hymenobacter polaris]NML63591.1 hypothetical protein [Hymenobacter polaris]
MHNIDRTLQEFETGAATNGEFESSYEASGAYGQELEYGQEMGQEFGQEYSGELEMENEQEQLVGELAQELLEVSNEQELNQFLGNLVSQATGAASQLLTSPAGQSVGRYLVDFGKQTLPQLGGRYGGQAGAALGSRLGPLGARVGGWAGAQAGQWAGGQAGNWLADNAKRVFGLELEMLSPESQELEISRAYVRFATDVARRADRALRRNPGLALGALGRQVLGAAAPLYAPGLLAGARSPARSGTWERRGRAIVLYNV